MIVLLSFVCFLYFAQVMMVWWFIDDGRSNKSVDKGDPISQLSVVIPFKNERDRIPELISSINELSIPSHLNVEFIFVDDSSTDQTSNFIEKYLKIQHLILQSTGKGKKDAIHVGIQASKFDFILTWDADIKVKKNYFTEISRLPQCDLWVLGVEMIGKDIIQELGSIEFSWLQVLTFNDAQNKKAGLCNGANLLFKKSVYEHFSSVREDILILSGDDFYLLKWMRANDKDIRAYYSKDSEVQTEAPSTFKDLLNQRKRWISKMGAGDSFPFFIGIISLLIFAFLNYFCLIAVEGRPAILILFLVKFAADITISSLYKSRMLKSEEFTAVFFHQFWYPFYLVRLLFHQIKDEKWVP
jgi:cellulose synthase/poly-beta-1,6-N-acetylglucosamine synthase-like glycosyltransferase